MDQVQVTVVRIYITEKSKLSDRILNYLHDEAKMRGVSLFRAVTGFGEDKALHTSFLVDLSLNLPLVIEFFDSPEKVALALEHLNPLIKDEHIIWWTAYANSKNT